MVAITSGANINFERLRLVAELANVGATTEATLATTIPERKGSFRRFIATATANGAIDVTEFKYRCAAPCARARGEWRGLRRASALCWGASCWCAARTRVCAA